jgi:hypothetical protein
VTVDEQNLIELSSTRPPSLEQDRDAADGEYQQRRDGNDRHARREQKRCYRDQQPETDVHTKEMAAPARLTAAGVQVRHILQWLGRAHCFRRRKRGRGIILMASISQRRADGAHTV